MDDVDAIWAADLIDMSTYSTYNKGVKFLLAVIDTFSKYGWLIPIKNKSGLSVANALKSILKERQPKKMWVDKGKEFYNKHVRDLVELYSTENEEKSCTVERWNRTMKERMFKYFTEKSTYKYINIIDDLVHQYNTSYHSSIKMTPEEASQPKNKQRVLKHLYSDRPELIELPRFAVGDYVRISKKKSTFEKGYTPNWTEEIFKISDIQYTTPITYKLVDLNQEEIKGTFYEKELQKTVHTELFRIEKVIKRRGDRSLVKWKGYANNFNSWIKTKDLSHSTLP